MSVFPWVQKFNDIVANPNKLDDINMKKIKILVDGRWFDSYYSGVTTYLKGLYNAVAKDQNFAITIIGSDIVKLEKEFPDNVSFIEMQSKSKIKRLYYDIPKIITKYEFDYAHFQYMCPLVKRCKYIVTLHDLLFLDYKKSFPLSFIIKNTLLFYISAKRADMLLTISEFSKQRISHYFKISNDRIYITPCGILECFNDSSDLPDVCHKYNIKKYILFVSRLEPRKNHIALLKAFVELKLFEDYHLVFIGKKTIDVRSLDEYLASLPNLVKEKVLYIENVSEEELHGFYAKASVFVYPSISEGFGIPPIEAISSGAKIICSNATALGDFDFLHEYQFSPDNIEEIKEKLSYALNDNSYPIKQFQEIVNTRYRWGKIADNFKQLIINDQTSTTI